MSLRVGGLVAACMLARAISVAIAADGDTWAVGEGGAALHRGPLPPSPTPTPTPTWTSTATRTTTATRSATPTITAGPSPTTRPTATCPSGWESTLAMSFEPPAARPGRVVTAFLTGRHFGFDSAWISLDMPGQDTIAHQWRSESGWGSSAAIDFPAPLVAGEWSARASGSGEVTFCVDGQIGWAYGGASTTHPITLTVSGETLFVPSAARYVDLVSTAEATRTPTATATQTATGTPTVTSTPRPSYLAFDG